MTGARGIMVVTVTEIVTERGIEIGTEIGIGEMIVGEMIETVIGIGTGIEIETGTGIERGIDVGMNRLAAARLPLTDIVKAQTHLVIAVHHLVDHLHLLLKRRNRG